MIRILLSARAVLICLPVLLAQSLAAQVPGNIIYNYIELSAAGVAVKLAAINADRSGDQFVPINLRNPYYPVWSRDGQALAVAASDPARPDKLSTDVYVWQPGTGRITKLSGWEDLATASGFLTFYPSYLAFSPDGQRVAAGMVSYSGARGTTIYTNQFGDPTGPYDTSSQIRRCVSLLIFGINGGQPIEVATPLCDDDSGDAGEGVDWSPTQDLLAYPYNTPTAFGGAVVALTGINLIVPSAGAAELGGRRQLTFPTGTVGAAFDPVAFSFESDYGPAFSPDGRQVAYIRALTLILQGQIKLPIFPSIRIVNVDGSNDHEVTHFAQGSYITRLTWSPDGRQLVLDFGQQALRQGFPLRLFDVNTVSLASIRTDGSGFGQLRGAPAVWPCWRPSLLNPSAPALGIAPANSGNQMVLSWPADGGNSVLEQTTQLGPQVAWMPVSGTPVTGGGQTTLTVPRTGSQAWFRLRRTQ